MIKSRRSSKFLAILIAIFLLTTLAFPFNALAAKGGGKPGGDTGSSTTINYVALGDSIATGTVTYWSNITSYVTYFYQYLQSIYGTKNVKLQNLAHDGDTTYELLDKLTTDSTVRTAVSNADVITISIGGNNLMQAAEIPGFTTINWDDADKGTVDFIDQWDDIINKINGLKKLSAKVIVTTVYNPYNINPPRGYEKDLGLHELTDIRITQINATINDNKDVFGYKVADNFTAFDSYSSSTMGKITYFYPSLFNYLFRNPHPNASGQAIITDLHKKAFSSF